MMHGPINISGLLIWFSFERLFESTNVMDCPREAIDCCSKLNDVNKNPTRCNSMQIFIYCKATLHVSGVTAPIIRSPDQATLEGSSCTSIMTCTGGYGYSF